MNRPRDPRFIRQSSNEEEQYQLHSIRLLASKLDANANSLTG